MWSLLKGKPCPIYQDKILFIILQLIIYSNFINPLMVLSLIEGNIGNTEEQLNEINSELPCLDSSRECVEQLTEAAIASSPKLKTLDVSYPRSCTG